MLVGRAQHQFADLIDHPFAYDAFMERILRLVDAPWDAWLVYPDRQQTYRETQFGEHGLLSFYLDENNDLLIIFNIPWTG